MRVIAYIREVPGGPRAGALQVNLRSWARRAGLEVVRVFEDTLMDYAPGLTRCGIMDLLEWKGTCQGVLAPTSEDLCHPHLTFNPAQEVRARGWDVISCTESAKELRVLTDRRRAIEAAKLATSPQAWVEPRVTGSKRISEKQIRAMQRGRERAVKRGGVRSGPVPYGYRRSGDGYVVETTEADVVRLIFKLYMTDLYTLKKVVDDLGARGSRTARGKAWSRCGLSWILKNEFYVGVVKYGKVRAMGRHTRIVARIVYNKVQQKMKKNRRR